MDDPGSPQYIALIVLLFLSAYFSCSETALTSLNKIKLRTMLDNNMKGAKDVEKLTQDTSKLLSVILICNNLVNVSASTIATSMAISFAQDNSLILGITTILVTMAILIFGEITPKTIAVNNVEKVACLVAKPMRLFVAVFSPISIALNFIINGFFWILRVDKDNSSPIVTETELKTMVNVSHEEGILKKEERRMIHNVFDFDDSHAKDVMVPRTDMIVVSVDANFNDVMNIFKAEQFSRLPVYRDDTDHIVGILHLKDITFLEDDVKSSFKISKYMRTPYFSHEFKPTSELLNEMRSKSIQMAVILDEYGGTSGIVTLEDLIEEIVGEIYDEYDDAEDINEIEIINENEFSVDGGIKISDFNETVGTFFESEDYDSIGGFVIGLFGKIPEIGESITVDNVVFIVESVDKKRVDKLKVNYVAPRVKDSTKDSN